MSMNKDLSIAKTTLNTPYGEFQIVLHQETPYRIISLSRGEHMSGTPIVRIHSSCIFSEIFHSKDCDCRDQLNASFELISANQSGGIIVYSDQEGRGLGLEGKFRVHELERQGMDTVASYASFNRKPEFRDYAREINVLLDLNISKNIILVSGNPDKIKVLEEAGFKVTQTINATPAREVLSPMAQREIRTKEEKLGYDY